MRQLTINLNKRYRLLCVGERALFWLLAAWLILPWLAGALAFVFMQSLPIFLLGGAGCSILGVLVSSVFVARASNEAEPSSLPAWAPFAFLIELGLLIAPVLMIFSTYQTLILERPNGEAELYLLRAVDEHEVGRTYLLQLEDKESFFAVTEVIEEKGQVDFAWPNQHGGRGLLDADAFTGQRWRVELPLRWQYIFGGEFPAPKLGREDPYRK